MGGLEHNIDSWYTTSYSTANMTCVQARYDGRAVAVRDSKEVAGSPAADSPIPTIEVAASDWSRFVAGLRSSRTPGASSIRVDDGGGATVTVNRSDVTLTFNRDEWVAFLAGVDAGEFDLSAHPAD